MKIYDPVVAGTRDGSGSFIHDRALLRAETAKFKPPKLDTDPSKTVFVGRLPLDLTEDRLREVFSGCGTLRNLHLVRHKISRASQGYAFLTFKHSADVNRAIALHGSEIGGKRILVEREVGRLLPGWKPRRLGGGFGGRKESGQMRFGGRACPHSDRETKFPARSRADRKERERCCSTPTRRRDDAY
ncbi:U11/U12 small nuclear ribonucleoprotein 35 kDa protein [Galendromus occidentalis]|uniref:U11/U12 small nuclear ribonucleoprotein 35 kDa protein n=1 Tax=Galendromus occidentalis TaxID=34638 RepID=A0AAJ6QU79_9ACAR|nr:U11/U12 small nuclear ribonucleoprotein 35 kDa protein [Galendromus occidentalis]